MAPVDTRTRRPSRPLAYAAAAAAVALGAAGCSLGGGSGEEPSATEAAPVDAAPIFEAALDDLRAAPALAVQGKVAAGGGDGEGEGVNDAALTVTGTGATQGTYKEGENEAEVLEAEGRLFLNAADEFWLDQSVANPDSDSYAGSWVRIAPSLIGIDPGTVLAPGALADTLEEMGTANARASLEDLDGTPGYRIDLEGGEKNRIWVSEEEPHRILRMEIENLAPAGDGGDSEAEGARVQFDVTQPEAADVDELYTSLIGTAKEDLTSSRDARIALQWDGQLELDCKTGGACTVSGTAKDVSEGAGEGKVIVRLDATFDNEELGEKKCDSTEVLEAGGSASISCGVDYALEPSADPQEYEINAGGLLSTRGLSKSASEKITTELQTAQKELAEGGGQTEESQGEGQGGSEGGGQGEGQGGGEGGGGGE
ncbi:hypothetical protein [Nocardiopsis coralliicola]